MNQAVKTKWIEALRSNKYKQGREALRTWAGCFCCLGVLCDVVHPDGWEIIRNRTWDARPDYMFKYNNETDGIVVPNTVRQSCGLTRQEMIKLANMNDSGLKTFKDIANYIEKNL